MTDSIRSSNSYDIAIIGGGLSGLLTACALTKQVEALINIAIVDANSISPNQTNSFDDRVIALAHGSVDYLKQLDVWHLMADDATPIHDIHISDRGNYGKARIKADDHNVEALGYVIPLASIANGLLSALKTTATVNENQIDWFAPDTISDIEFHQTHVNIALSSQHNIEAKLVAACDGGQSVCRKAANISVESNDYQQCAVIANVEMEQCHQNRAFERFTDAGPIAMLPMQGNQCSLVWTLTPSDADRIAGLNDEEFCLALEQAFGHWLGKVKRSSRRSVFPLSLVKAETQSYHRLALVGNASHTIHPIAGQGFNLGLRDVKVLVDLISQTLVAQGDVGAGKLLNQYQVSREQDQQSVIQLTDSMVTLFSNDLPPLVAGRNIGLKVMNYLSPLQKAFVNKTMGY